MTHQLIKQEAKEGRWGQRECARWGETRCLRDCLCQCVFMIFARVRNHILMREEVEQRRRRATGADVLAFGVFFSSVPAALVNTHTHAQM